MPSLLVGAPSRKRKHEGPCQCAATCQRIHIPRTPWCNNIDVHVHRALLQYLDCATVPIATCFLHALRALPAAEHHAHATRCSMCKVHIPLFAWQVSATGRCTVSTVCMTLTTDQPYTPPGDCHPQQPPVPIMWPPPRSLPPQHHSPGHSHPFCPHHATLGNTAYIACSTYRHTLYAP